MYVPPRFQQALANAGININCCNFKLKKCHVHSTHALFFAGQAKVLGLHPKLLPTSFFFRGKHALMPPLIHAYLSKHYLPQKKSCEVLKTTHVRNAYPFTWLQRSIVSKTGTLQYRRLQNSTKIGCFRPS